MIGLYLHIPFCKSKCAYCDFYSVAKSADDRSRYLDALIGEFSRYRGAAVDTVYLGGGTPSLLTPQEIEKLLLAVHKNFKVSDGAEITLEANPADDRKDFFKSAVAGGANRLSLGVQSSDRDELRLLSRRHRNADVERSVEDARNVGIHNLSLDLMLGIPNQTERSLLNSIEFLMKFSPQHISAYMLSLEPGTPLYAARDTLNLPSAEQTAALYLKTVQILKNHGFSQYEISNFSREGFSSRHNLKYWCLDDYIGIGPAAHGFLNGRRYCYSRDLDAFLKGPQPIDCGTGGDAEEYMMLQLRLSKGLSFKNFETRYFKLPPPFFEKAALYERHGLLKCDNGALHLTPEGFLVSNELIAELLATVF